MAWHTQFSNVHPWFANVSIAQAAGWTYNFFEDINVDAAQNVSNQPTMYIGETGWPTVLFSVFGSRVQWKLMIGLIELNGRV